MRKCWLSMLLGWFYLATPAHADQLVADLSSHIIAVRADFHGAQLVLFGTLDPPLTPEDNLLVLIRGPLQHLVVRQKKSWMGLWLNKGAVEFRDVPAFYRIYAAHDLDQTIPDVVRNRHNIGLDSLVMVNEPNENPYRQYIVDKRLLPEERTYSNDTGGISFLGNSLFRAEIDFPQRVPVGLYTVETLLIRQGVVIAAQTSPLQISKDGIGADVAWLAHEHAYLYGLITLIIALSGGGLAAFIWGKRT
jgi:uncharacterized protein (TIGR02186 family)